MEPESWRWAFSLEKLELKIRIRNQIKILEPELEPQPFER